MHRHLPLALLAAVAAVVAAPTLTSAPTATATNAWISVGSDGSAHTITAEPTSTDSHAEGTGSTTNTLPEATATNGAGAFPVCQNTAGAQAPFCAPSDGSTLNPGGTYYITWDPTYFASTPNTSVVITGNLFNASTGAIVQQAFSSGTLAAGWSFYAWSVDASLLKGAGSAGVNVSLSMVYLTGSSSQANTSASVSSSQSAVVQGPVVTVAKPSAALPELTKAPTGPALYIGLPAVFGFIIVVLAGTFLWNRHHRHIGLGNVMSRSRFGPLGSRSGYGIRKSRRQRAAVGAINLDSKDTVDLGNRFHGRVDSGSGSTSHRPADRLRRDSDLLGSLAGTPTEDRFNDDVYHPNTTHTGSSTTGNAFRDELARQQRSG
ncbi:hypothetical protein CMQ_2040 [Grosmannia clavigera kw1407]|uniref:Uncharacterized protein n=1 Tax=Grosmannia clavigera (strain kw1407 / UAMH 11150) TaxID=655863 RepID=F0XN07_GROCL|nr:uncharacterized protein CMQ_2040 [Grosmannia clavigera kw1407]EFX00959.1 hypothetical protein CMQ_2040 [Grosmannia clavigera kw1407]